MWEMDPKLLLFTLSRHKFIAKMLKGYDAVLEIGCGDGFASRIIQPEVGHLISIDFDNSFVEEAKAHSKSDWNVSFHQHNILDAPFKNGDSNFDAAFSLDVFEHIPPGQSKTYAENVIASLKKDGVFICGCPSLESQVYASRESKEGHVNCMTGQKLREFYKDYFSHVFLYSMNDEVLHTGFSPMSHYNFVLCTTPKN